MAKTALYQKYRSATFDEVIGQEYIVRSIKNAVREGKIGHAYLFCGPRGTGKTTMARLLAKSVNCENPTEAPCGHCENCIAAANGTHPDIIEINAANETHVEDIRDLIERSRLAPMQGLHKVYIIDEVHQLSSAASSALLKTLEEPPENVIFILATTDPQKLLPTIISRCQRYDFSKVRKDQIRDHLLNIAEKENIKMEPKAAEMIAVLSDGGMRDALSIMDQCASYTSDDITEAAIDRIYGLTGPEEKISMIRMVLERNLAEIIGKVQAYEQQGIDLQKYTDGMIDILKDTVIYAYTKDENLLKVLNAEQAESLSAACDPITCMHISEKLLESKERYRLSVSASSCFEVTMLSLAVDTDQAVEKQPVTVVNHTAAKETKQSEPVSVPEKSETPAAEEVKPEIKPQDKLSDDFIVSLLVQCNKAEKALAEEKMRQISDIKGLEYKKYTTLLEGLNIAACGEDCILLTSPNQSVCNRVNDPVMNEELYYFVKENINLDKMIYALTPDDFRQAAGRFMQLRKEGNLPEKFNVVRYQKEIVKEKTPEEKVIELFGPDMVEIVGG